MKRAVLVGRPNVGKSALFNRLAGRRISIVHDQPGVTRDRIEAVCRTGASPFGIVDTGGIGAAPDPESRGVEIVERVRSHLGAAGWARELLLVGFVLNEAQLRVRLVGLEVRDMSSVCQLVFGEPTLRASEQWTVFDEHAERASLLVDQCELLDDGTESFDSAARGVGLGLTLP